MIELYGKLWSREDLEKRTGQLAQIAGIREVTLQNGPEQGVRVLEFRSGSGLSFTINIDRGFDLGECSWGSYNLGWVSATGTRNPALHEHDGEGGFGWLRSFSGMNATCGLDQNLFPATDDVSHYNYPPRKEMTQPLHGRIANSPARLLGYGERWNEDGSCTLWARGLVKQVSVFAENLWLYRSVEVDMGTDRIRLHDEVVNMGFSKTTHMFLYHLNFGFPLLDAETEYVAPVADIIWASHSEQYENQGVGYRVQSGPLKNFSEQVYEHDMRANAEGKVPVMLINRGLNGDNGLAVKITTHKSQFPCQFEWQALSEGCYAIGIEPSTHHVLGKNFARQRDEIRWLEYRESFSYDLEIEVIHRASAIQTEAELIKAIIPQPEVRFPAPKENWFSIKDYCKPAIFSDKW
ncbi:aldose 1-epimerase family protein [Pantoea sp. Al-1710]|uniref:Aldose 1-epimerase family protein n=1 Tax=Candidatus Pantoea communis TaxID=2608354 RepID=A0ABX0RU96_9GAMM|nr:aldose 1-epimerase family protein [Pantoea communis]NIG19334.1 aldose 1-epimerase family protein [Pantoea communis]